MNLAQWPYLKWERRSYSETAIGSIALAICILSGSTFNAFSKQLSEELAPLSLIFVSEILTVTFSLLTYGLLPTIGRLKKLNREQWLSILMVASLIGIAGPFLWFTGITYTTAVNASFYGRTELPFMLILAHFVLGERLTRMHWLSMVTILAGILTIVLRGFTDVVDIRFGDMLIVASVFCYGTGHIIFRKKLHKTEPYLALFMRSVCAISFFLILSPFMNLSFIDQITEMPSTFIAPLLGFAFISRFLNSMTFYQAAERLPMTVVSLLSTLSLIGSAGFAALYLGEKLSWYHAAGALLIIAGNILVDAHAKRPDAHIEHRLAQKMHN